MRLPKRRTRFRPRRWLTRQVRRMLGKPEIKNKRSRYLHPGINPAVVRGLPPKGEAGAEHDAKRDELAPIVSDFYGCDGEVIEHSDFQLSKIYDRKNKKKADLVICTAFAGRRQIMERIIHESYAGRPDEAARVHWMLVGSDAEDLAFIRAMNRRHGRVAGFIVDNRPLGRKWQTCLHTAWRYFDAELYAINGSDDLLSHQLLRFILNRHEHNQNTEVDAQFLPSMYGAMEWLVWNVNEQSNYCAEIVKCNYAYETAFEPLGAGRFYTRRFLNQRNGLIFESDKEKLLDDRGYFDLCEAGGYIEYYTAEQGPIVSVKGAFAQMNTFEAFLEAPTLKTAEYSFRGKQLLSRALSPDTLSFLQKPGRVFSQLNPPRKVLPHETPHHPEASQRYFM